MATRGVSMLGNKELESNACEEWDECFVANRAPHKMKLHQQIEDAGKEVSYYCVDCLGCSNCKTSGRIESISIEEEVEDALIEGSVTVHPVEGYTKETPEVSQTVAPMHGFGNLA